MLGCECLADYAPHMEDLKKRSRAVIPGGVNSPVRAFKSVGGNPLFAKSARGAILNTVDGRELIDFCLSFGPLIHGHAHPEIIEAVQQAATRGTSYAVTTEAEIELAERITGAVNSMDKVRMVNSGTEAVMTAVRLARGATGRQRILKFSGCYHGHLDSLLVSAGSGVAGIASASSAGVSDQDAGNTLVTPFNDLPSLKNLIDQYGSEIAVIAVEPIAANMGLVLPEPGFLLALRELCDECGALLLFDEVITGFRMTYGSYSNLCGVTPDLTCLGKIIGGGMPIGAVGGRAELMDHLAPDGDVYQAGTLSGNPISVACGLANLNILERDDPYPALATETAWFAEQVRNLAGNHGVALQVPQIASLFSLFFMEKAPHNFEEVKHANADKFVTFFHSMLEQGVYLAPSAFECGFLSSAHTRELLNTVLAAMDVALAKVAAEHQ